MNKKALAVALELIPIISAPLAIIFIYSSVDSQVIRSLIGVFTLLGFFGFVFSFIGRRIAKGEKIVRVLSILDILATVAIIIMYVLVFIALGSQEPITVIYMIIAGDTSVPPAMFYFTYSSIARLTNSAVPVPPALSIFAWNSALATYILPRPARISSVHSQKFCVMQSWISFTIA